MTPKEKAEELMINVFREQHADDSAKLILISTPKIAMLICDEIVGSTDTGILNRYEKKAFDEYWNSVKQEIKTFDEL